jgi:transposase
MKPKPDPDMVAHAVAQVAAGHTYAHVAQELRDLGYKLSDSTIAVWVRNARKGGAGPATSQPVRKAPDALLARLQGKRDAEAQKEPPPKVDVTDTLGTLRTLVEGMLAEAHAAKLSNPKLSATLAKNAGELMNTILRGEKTKAEDETLLRISRSGIAEQKAAVLERIKVLATERPLLCSRCSCALSVEWGDAAQKIADAKKLGGS